MLRALKNKVFKIHNLSDQNYLAEEQFILFNLECFQRKKKKNLDLSIQGASDLS